VDTVPTKYDISIEDGATFEFLSPSRSFLFKMMEESSLKIQNNEGEIGITTVQTEKIPSYSWQTDDTDVENGINNSSGGEQRACAANDPNNIVNWDGPDDPEMAINWTAKWKWINILLLATLTLFTCVLSHLPFWRARNQLTSVVPLLHPCSHQVLGW
jgi:hypothetical protein